MDKDYTLPKSERLKSLTAVRRLFKDGASGFVYPFRYMTLSEECDTPCAKALFSVPKRYHKRANKRNTLRRRTKEAYRLNKEALYEAVSKSGKSLDIAFIYSTKDILPYKTIEHAVRRILAEVVGRM